MFYADRSAHWTSAVRSVIYAGYPSSINTAYLWNGNTIVIDARPGWWSDPLFRGYKFYTPEVECSVPELLGWSYYPRRIASLTWEKPREKNYFPADDWAEYGNTLGGFLDVVTPRPVQDSFKKEHNVDHLTLGGNGFAADFSKPIKWPWDHPAHRCFPVTGIEGTTLNRHFDDVSVFIHSFFGDYRFAGSNLFGTLDNTMGSAMNLWDLLRRTASVKELRCDVTSYNECVIRDFVYEASSTLGVEGLNDRSSVSFSYELEVRVHMNDVNRTLLCLDTYHVKGFFETMIMYPAPSTSPVTVGRFKIQPNTVTPSFWISYQHTKSEDYVKILNPGAWNRGSGSPTGILTSVYADLMWDRTGGSRTNIRNDAPILPPITNQSVHRWMGRLNQFTKDYAHDIRATSLYSSADAINGLDIDSNFFESVPELPALLSVIGLGFQTWSDLRKVLRGDLSRLIPVARDISAAFLFYQYGLKPAVSDVENVAHLISSDLKSAMKKLSVVRGSFTHDFEVQYSSIIGEGKLTLKTRSKIVLNGLSPLPEFLIGAGGFGFKPTLANVWDLVPFSFVADWFFNLSDRYSDIDASILLHLVAPSYYVHSYTVKYIPTHQELEAAGLGIMSTVYGKRFTRDVSRISPVPRETKIDFRAPPSLTNRLISAGALLGVLAT